MDSLSAQRQQEGSGLVSGDELQQEASAPPNTPFWSQQERLTRLRTASVEMWDDLCQFLLLFPVFC